ncbi:hypothetical protein [Solidesulfovibrio magneticus]
MSCGATRIQKNDTINKIFNRADIALYKSKQNGKNCVTIG